MQNYLTTVDVTTEPVTITEAKTHLRVTSSADDTYITALIKAARVACENYTSTTMAPKTIRLTMDGMPGAPGAWWDGVREGPLSFIQGVANQLVFAYPPLFAVSSFKYYDDSDAEYTFSSTNYYVDNSDPGQRGRLVLRRGAVWPPIALRVAAGIIVDFTAGFGNTGYPLPEGFKQALLKVISFMYKNRGSCADDGCAAAYGDLEPYRIEHR